jgi:hypothetical protein
MNETELRAEFVSLLTNVAYLGKVRYKDEIHDSNHVSSPGC